MSDKEDDEKDRIATSPFTEKVRDLSAKMGEPMPAYTVRENEESQARLMRTPLGQALQSVCENCLREATLRQLRANTEQHRKNGNAPAVELGEAMYHRMQHAPKGNMMAYWVGFGSVLTITQKKALIKAFEVKGRACIKNAKISLN